MSWLEKSVELIDKWESCKLKAYKDIAGIWTIGWGSIGHDIVEGTVWTQQQADDRRDIKISDIAKCIDRNATCRLNDNQKAALVCFVYNIGQSAFINSTMLKLLKANDYTGAALQFARWNKATVRGKLVVSEGLTNRRKDEAEIFTQLS